MAEVDTDHELIRGNKRDLDQGHIRVRELGKKGIRECGEELQCMGVWVRIDGDGPEKEVDQQLGENWVKWEIRNGNRILPRATELEGHLRRGLLLRDIL